jgi:hypothetical protein
MTESQDAALLRMGHLQDHVGRLLEQGEKRRQGAALQKGRDKTQWLRNKSRREVKRWQ